MKTLIGKNNYLFLINDSARSFENHCDSNYTKKGDVSRYEKYLEKLFVIVFPDKECICSQFLPDGFVIRNRSMLEYYNSKLNDKLMNTTGILDHTDYYITDTHINVKGLYKVYKKLIQKLNLNDVHTNLISTPVECLVNLGLGTGDLTWPMNKGTLVLGDISDIYYNLSACFPFYCQMKITKQVNENNVTVKIFDNLLNDITAHNINELVTWDLLSKNIIYSNYENALNKLKILIFYDSFLIPIITLLMKTFKECYFSKTHFDHSLVDSIKPDLILEFRVERFLI